MAAEEFAIRLAGRASNAHAVRRHREPEVPSALIIACPTATRDILQQMPSQPLKRNGEDRMAMPRHCATDAGNGENAPFFLQLAISRDVPRNFLNTVAYEPPLRVCNEFSSFSLLRFPYFPQPGFSIPAIPAVMPLSAADDFSIAHVRYTTASDLFSADETSLRLPP